MAKPTDIVVVTRPDYAGVAQELASLNVEIRSGRDLTISVAKQTIDKVIEGGEKLTALRDQLRGEFVDWLKAYRAGNENFPSVVTCYKWMRAAKYKKALANGASDLGTQKDLYICAGILPQAEESDHQDRQPAKFRILLNLAVPDPAQWEPGDRREFLRQAKPVIDLYDRVKAVEAA